MRVAVERCGRWSRDYRVESCGGVEPSLRRVGLQRGVLIWESSFTDDNFLVKRSRKTFGPNNQQVVGQAKRTQL